MHPVAHPPAPDLWFDTPAVRALLGLLREAHDCSRAIACDAWQFAVEIDALRTAGLTNNTLRWLLLQGYVHQGYEVTTPSAPVRQFCPVASLALQATSCFVLSEAGVRFLDGPDAALLRLPAAPAPSSAPVWDAFRQALSVGCQLVKQFKVPAPNQELILATFQEEQWPVRIDDPLPPRPGLEPKRRLHETIASLNRSQKARLLRFIGDGHGMGVRWEFV